MISSGTSENNALSYVELEKCNEVKFASRTEMWDFIQQLFEVLDRLHQQGWVHGDIKPENLGWSKCKDNSKVLKLFDFGLSYFLGKGEKHNKKGFGTRWFRAPEISEEGDGISDHKIDVYSAGMTIGCLFYHQLAWCDSFYHFFEPNYEGRISEMTRLSRCERLTNLIAKIVHPDQQKRPYAREVLQEYFPDSRQLVCAKNKKPLSSQSVYQSANKKPLKKKIIFATDDKENAKIVINKLSNKQAKQRVRLPLKQIQ